MTAHLQLMRPRRRFSRAAVAFAVAVAGFAVPFSTASGDDGGFTSFVVGGDDTFNPGYIAALLQADVADPFQAQFCGGSLISARVIVTAAHCVDFLTVDDLRVAIGFTELSAIGPDDRAAIEAIEIHPDWDDDIFSTDIALLRLVDPVTQHDPVPIEDDPAEPVIDRILVVAGWGSVDVTKTFYPDVMQAAGAITFTDTTTTAQDGGLICGLVDPTDDVCFGGNTTAACNGDSGGPLLAPISPGSDELELVALVSYGPADQCLAPTQLDGAQRLSSYIPWIDGIIASWFPPPPTTTTAPQVLPKVELNCPNPALPFVDVAATSFAHDDIACIFGLGITNGTSDTTYAPKSSVTREQIAAFIARTVEVVGVDCPTPTTPFTDVDPASFALDDIACIFGLGITGGTTPTTYDPKGEVTREQMAVFIARMIDALGQDCPSPALPFFDVAATSFAHGSIACILGLDITTGVSPLNYDPSGVVTREQMAAFIARTIRAL